jgi:hypothetical protein
MERFVVLGDDVETEALAECVWNHVRMERYDRLPKSSEKNTEAEGTLQLPVSNTDYFLAH